MYIENMLNYLFKLKEQVSIDNTSSLEEQLEALATIDAETILFNQKVLNNFYRNINRNVLYKEKGCKYLILNSEYFQNPSYKKLYGISLDHIANIKTKTPLIILFTEEQTKNIIDYVDETELYQHIQDTLDSEYLNEDVFKEQSENLNLDSSKTPNKSSVSDSYVGEGQIHSNYVNPLKEADNTSEPHPKLKFSFVTDKLIYVEEVKESIEEEIPTDFSKKTSHYPDIDFSNNELAMETKESYTFHLSLQEIINYVRAKSTESYIPNDVYKDELNEIFSELPFKFSDFYKLILDIALKNEDKITSLGFITQEGLIFKFSDEIDFYIGFPIVKKEFMRTYKVSLFKQSTFNKYSFLAKVPSKTPNELINIKDLF